MTYYLENLFNPRSVAVIGNFASPDKWASRIFRNIVTYSSLDRVYAVTPDTTEVMGKKAYPSIDNLPEAVDLLMIASPAAGLPEVMRQCVRKGIKTAIVISAGLAETGESGEQLQREINTIARSGGLRFVGPNCIGHFNTETNIFTVSGQRPVKRGGISIISHSGGTGSSIVQYGSERGLGFNKFASTGNEADLHLEDFLEYFGKDEQTRIILAYIEGLKEGRRFFELAREITKTKPIIVMKAGRTRAGERAVKTHTASIAGEDNVYRAAFKQAGVRQVNDVEEMIDVAAALMHLPLPGGKRVGIVARGGGIASLTADACEMAGLDVAPLSPMTIEKLNAILPARWPHANPVETVGGGTLPYPLIFSVIEDDNFDAVVASSTVGSSAGQNTLANGTPVVSSGGTADAKELEELDKVFDLMDKYQKPVLFCSAYRSESEQHSPVYRKLRDNGMMIYTVPRAMTVLTHMIEYSRYLRSSGSDRKPVHAEY